ncbi:4-diphosphocytidyl-2-C-methyl-D-erythritol kinase domain protein [Neisseria meningitidis NM3158]|nr:4-diphosphocytidyl-2-C-methyl-D-erythritol kinase domain protein [Neisseria meningitidis NM3158]
MNTDNLHDILDEMVQVYSQKKQSRSETPAEIGAHFHPLLDRLCETAEAQNASDILISKGFPPSLKINSALTPQPQKALTGEETAAIAASTMNAEQSEIFRRDGEINYSASRAAARATAPTPTTAKAAQVWFCGASTTSSRKCRNWACPKNSKTSPSHRAGC